MLVGALPPAGLLTLLSCSLPTLMGRMVGVNCRVSSPPPPNPPPPPRVPKPFSCHQPSPHLLFRGLGGMQPSRVCVATLSWQRIPVNLPRVKAVTCWDFFSLPPRRSNYYCYY